MAEKLANLQHREDIQTFEIDVTNLNITSPWGNLYINNPLQLYDLGIDITNKKVFITANLSHTVGTSVTKRRTTEIEVDFFRPNSVSGINGKIYVMVTD